MRAPNCVYVIPPEADLTLHGGCLTLVPRQQTRNLHLPIDGFFRALATDLSARAIGVVLSGSGADGTEGLRAIKEAGGITFAQEPDTAQFRSMPESAIAAGVVDFRSPLEEIASELVRLGHHAYLMPSAAIEAADDETRPDDDGALARVLAAVWHHTRLDFKGYKRPTILRRIDRRMALRRVASLDAYADALREDPVESKALAQDIVNVTSFFRDPLTFEALGKGVLPELLAGKREETSLRAWVAGCSTGQDGGDVGAESGGEGKGASFTVTLPFSAQERPEPPVVRGTVARSVRGVRVLLIEDDDDMREAFMAMLEEQGAEVRAACSGADGFAALEAFTPQVILCDIAMPGEDGYAFIRKLRSAGRSMHIPAAALTALAAEEDRRRVLASGFQMHIAKPVDADRLATAVAALQAWPQPLS